MAKAGDTYTITLKKTHLEWGTHRYTGSRGSIYGEGYIPIPSHCAYSFGLKNGNATNKRGILGVNLFNCISRDGAFHGQLKSQGCSSAGVIYAKQFSANNDLKALGAWYAIINARVGDQIKVTWVSATDMEIEKI